MSLTRSVVHCVATSADPLEGLRFTFGQLANLFEVYASSGSAKGLSIRGYKLSAAAAAEMGLGLRSLKRKLNLLDFAYCSLGDQGAINIMRALSDVGHGGEVHEIVLRLCRLSPDFGREVGRVFAHYSNKISSGLKETPLRAFGNLRAIDLSFNALGCAGVAPIIRHAPAGIQLDLSFTGLDVDSCTNLSQLDVAIASTEAASILLFGTGDSVTAHLLRQRHLSQTRKERQQVVDAKCLLAADNPDDVQTVTGGHTDALVRPELQFCRFGAPSVTVFLDGDLDSTYTTSQMPTAEECIATQEYLVSPNTETEVWTERLLKEVVAFVNEPMCKMPVYRPGRNYPPFVRGEVHGVQRVKDGRSTTIFSARSASCISQGNGNGGGLMSSRSGSAMRSPSYNNRSVSPFNFTNSFNKNRRSASANSLIRTATNNNNNNNVRSSSTNSARGGGGGNGSARGSARASAANSTTNSARGSRSNSVVENNNNNQNLMMTSPRVNDRSISITEPPGGEYDSYHFQNQAGYDPNGRTASVLTTLTNQSTISTNLCKPAYRTPFERDAPPVLNPNKNKNDHPEGNERQKELDQRLASSRSVSVAASPLAGNESTRSFAGSMSSVDLVASHLSPRGAVKRGRRLASTNGPTLLKIKDMTEEKRMRLINQLLDAAVVSESQCEKIFGIARPKEYLGPHCPAPETFMGEESAIPHALFEANATPSFLLRQPAGSEKRVAGIAKLLFYLRMCALPDSDTTWITHCPTKTVDLPEFLRGFGEGQRTVVQFRNQRQRENRTVRNMVDEICKEFEEVSVYQQQQQQVSSSSNQQSLENSAIVG